VVIAEDGGERDLDVVVAGLTTEVERVKMPRRQTGLQAAVHPLAARRLSTLFAAEFGLTPKEAARTMRFTHAVARIGEGVRGGALDLATVAAECGFADQPHLDREFRDFAGTSPTGWIAEEFPNIQAGGHRYARDWES
jgi:transcriptional regulator GlxA family with amidase domain